MLKFQQTILLNFKMALHRYSKISMDLHLILAPLHDGHPTHLVYVQRTNGDHLKVVVFLAQRKLSTGSIFH